MTLSERCLAFACDGDTLHGVLHLPPDTVRASGLGVVVVVGGPQTRVGSHRQFVLLARALAAAGHGVLRFDVRGMGDSEGEPTGFEAIGHDIAAALRAARTAMPFTQKLVLWGLCDAASAALLFVQANPNAQGVDALCLVNPWVRTAATQAQAQLRHYYLGRLATRAFWAKLLRGQVAASAARSLAGSVSAAWRPGPKPGSGDTALPYTQRMALACGGFPGPILLVLSGQDLTAQEFRLAWEGSADWRQARQRDNVSRVDLHAADHTFSDGNQRRSLENEVLGWLCRFASAEQTSGAAWSEGGRRPTPQKVVISEVLDPFALAGKSLLCDFKRSKFVWSFSNPFAAQTPKPAPVHAD